MTHRISVLGGAMVLALCAREHFAVPVECFNIKDGSIPPPNPRNDNAAKRQRAAKKRRKNKARK